MQPTLCPGHIAHTGTPKGRGVFAARDIAAGEVVEVCPVLLIHCPIATLPIELKRVIFNWSALAGMNGVHALALGYGSMYNHANPANLRYEAVAKGQSLRLSAEVNISSGSELTINYNALGGGTSSQQDTWFESVDIQPHVDAPPPQGG